MIRTIKRTKTRTIPILLKSEHENAGPYYLVDRAGYGVAWKKSKRENISRPGEYWDGRISQQRITWIPIFHRALLAFTLLDSYEDMSPREAKAIADKAWKRWGDDADPAEVERWAFYRIEHPR